MKLNIHKLRFTFHDVQIEGEKYDSISAKHLLLLQPLLLIYLEKWLAGIGGKRVLKFEPGLQIHSCFSLKDLV